METETPVRRRGSRARVPPSRYRERDDEEKDDGRPSQRSRARVRARGGGGGRARDGGRGGQSVARVTSAQVFLAEAAQASPTRPPATAAAPPATPPAATRPPAATPPASASSSVSSVSSGFTGFSPGFRTPQSSPGPSPAAAAPSLHGPDESPDLGVQDPALSGPARPLPGPAPPLPPGQSSPPHPSQFPGPDLDTQDGPETQPLQDPESLPDIVELFRLYKPTISHIPPSTAADFSREFGALCRRLAEDMSNITNWVLFYLFPFAILPAAPKDRRIRRSGLSQTQSIRDRLRRWRNGEAAALFREALKVTAMARRKNEARRRVPSTTEEQLDHNARRAALFAADGQYSKAVQCLGSEGLVPATEANLRKMQALHPAAEPPPTITTEEHQIQLTSAEVKKSVLSMKNGTSPGACGHRPEHWRVCLSEAAMGRRDRTLDAMTSLINKVASGKVPEQIRHLFASASLFGVPKRDGGLRPVAAGSLLRRVTAKAIARKLADKAANLFSPLQVGVGVRSNCESIVHSVRKLVQEDSNIMLVQTDLKSAFNQCDRTFMLRGVEQMFPEILEFVKTCYGQHSVLYFGDHEVLSQQGAQQGDSLGPLLMSVTLHPVLERIHDEVPRLVLGVHMLDDGCFAGKTEDLKAALDIMLEDGPPRGLFLSTDMTTGPGLGKSTLWRASGFGDEVEEDLLGRGLRLITDSGVRVLGAPLGSPAFVKQFLSAAVDKIEKLTDLLPRLQQSQTQYCLLRSCFSFPKFGYLLRTTPCLDHPEILRRFDGVTRNSLNELLGTVLDNKAYYQATLPVSSAGLGLRNASDHHIAAYIASITDSMDLILDLMKSEAGFCDEAGLRDAAGLRDEAGQLGEEDQQVEAGHRGDDRHGQEPGGGDQEQGSEAGSGVRPDVEVMASSFITPEILAAMSEAAEEEISLQDLLSGTSQRILSQKIDDARLKHLKEMCADSPREMAIINALTTPYSRGFLNVSPSVRAGWFLRSEQFSAIVKYQLCSPVYVSDFTCPACNQKADKWSDHSLVCASYPERVNRHDNVRNFLVSLASEAGLAPVREPRFLVPGSDRRPGDLLLPAFTDRGHGQGYQDTLVDVVLSSTTRGDVVVKNAESAGKAAAMAHDRKLRLMGEQCAREGFVLVPFSVESTGVFTPTAINLVTRLARARGIRRGIESNKSINNAFKSLSVIIQRSNAQMMINRFVNHAEMLPDPEPENNM